MESNLILHYLLKEEIEYYYKHIREYDNKRNIDLVIADDVYEKALEYDMCEVQKEAVLRAGTTLNELNGTVLFAPSKDKTTLVVLSKKMLIHKDPDEVHGTVLHELTHAHDYYDYVDYLKIEDYNKLFTSRYYKAFFMWTEFHARRVGYKRFIEYKFRKGWKQFKKHKFEFRDGITENFLIRSGKGRMYDLMQAAGRYDTFTRLCSSYTSNFRGDILEGNVETELVDVLDKIYQFLTENEEFEQFVGNITMFDKLLNEVEAVAGKLSS